ncbi:regulator of G-protein signaling 7-like [Varroa destructor]|uniref:Regulator of G-protein signaling 7 n=1 Tax=Varroa destructor TaxID=109461 RepID=A0A7M7KAI5_VARDE|nr:regulator of G-protein signaling 7-like [Varroa destructor]
MDGSGPEAILAPTAKRQSPRTSAATESLALEDRKKDNSTQHRYQEGPTSVRRSPSPTSGTIPPLRPPSSPNLSASSNCYTVDECYIEPCFFKMEKLVQEMQHPELGVPLRSQKLFLTSIPSAFVGYDVVEWIMDNLDIEDQSGPVAQEALHLANLLCQFGYFFPVGENAKTYTIKDDSTLYRFQSPMFWPSRSAPDNTDYAIYLLKRSMKNKQKSSLEEYEQEALQRLKKLLSTKWESICQQVEDIVAQSKDKKKPDKVITSSQERAYWRIHRPPPGVVSCLERCPVPNKRGPRKMTIEQLKRQTEILRRNLLKSRTKSTIWQRCDDYREFDAFMSPTLPSNPWITDDATFWAIESTHCDTPTERRLKRWTLSIEELLSDPRGFREFEIYLRKEYSHENILFWKAVQDLKKGSPSNIAQKVQAIFDEYLASGAACEVNLDSATMEHTMEAIKRPTRYTFENAQQHAFTLMQTDTYPRFLRSEHFNSLLQKAALIQIQGHRKRFFHFGASTRKKSANQDQRPSTPQQAGTSGISAQSTTLQPNEVRATSASL